MAVLSSSERKKLPKSDFGEPGKNAYPMPDWEHAADAKSRAKQQLNRGKLSQSEYDKICAKANAVMKREKK
jgi:hypothetical protein